MKTFLFAIIVSLSTISVNAQQHDHNVHKQRETVAKQPSLSASHSPCCRIFISYFILSRQWGAVLMSLSTIIIAFNA